MECPEKMRTYLEALEAERRKVEVFRNELPLCLELVNQAIEACKSRLSGATTFTTTTTGSMEGVNGPMSECSELNSTKGPVLEEFMPIKRVLSSDDVRRRTGEIDGHDDQHSDSCGDSDTNKKSNWLKSVQLWNPNPEPENSLEDSPPPPPKNGSGLGKKKPASDFHPSQNIEEAASKGSDGLPTGINEAAHLPQAAAASTSSTAERVGGGTGKKEEKQKGSNQRKQRRSWSVDLHRRFLHALHQLGGPHVATPKNIRELMKFDGLTNDEIKSHLQKYRLHAKGSPPQSNGNAQQPPQFVVVGGIWVPPPPQTQYVPTAASQGEAHGIYAPAAAPPSVRAPPQMQVLRLAQQKSRGSRRPDEFEPHGSSDYAGASSSGHSVTGF